MRTHPSLDDIVPLMAISLSHCTSPNCLSTEKKFDGQTMTPASGSSGQQEHDKPNFDKTNRNKLAFDWFFCFDSTIARRTFKAIKANKANSTGSNCPIAALHNGKNQRRLITTIEFNKCSDQKPYLYPFLFQNLHIDRIVQRRKRSICLKCKFNE